MDGHTTPFGAWKPALESWSSVSGSSPRDTAHTPRSGRSDEDRAERALAYGKAYRDAVRVRSILARLHAQHSSDAFVEAARRVEPGCVAAPPSGASRAPRRSPPAWRSSTSPSSRCETGHRVSARPSSRETETRRPPRARLRSPIGAPRSLEAWRRGACGRGRGAGPRPRRGRFRGNRARRTRAADERREREQRRRQRGCRAHPLFLGIQAQVIVAAIGLTPVSSVTVTATTVSPFGSLVRSARCTAVNVATARIAPVARFT